MLKRNIIHYGESSSYNWKSFNPFSDKYPWKEAQDKRERERISQEKVDRKRKDRKNG
jgi:hypothetical protein